MELTCENDVDADRGAGRADRSGFPPHCRPYGGTVRWNGKNKKSWSAQHTTAMRPAFASQLRRDGGTPLSDGRQWVHWEGAASCSQFSSWRTVNRSDGIQSRRIANHITDSHDTFCQFRDPVAPQYV
jgi:hypothetical protein